MKGKFLSIAFVFHLAVDPKYRNHGLAKYMLGCLVHRMSCLTTNHNVVLVNAIESAVPFYKSLGFEEADAMFDKLQDHKNGLVLLQLYTTKWNN